MQIVSRTAARANLGQLHLTSETGSAKTILHTLCTHRLPNVFQEHVEFTVVS